MASIGAALVFLIIIGVLGLTFFINPNNFKPEIAAAVKDKTGREIILEGDLKLALFPGLGLSTGKAALSNAPGFQDKAFATIEQSDIHIKLLPLLLAKKIEVSQIVLKGLALNLARNKQGANNWDDLTASSVIKPAPAVPDLSKETETETAFAIGGISIENAHINWDNQKTGKQLEIKDVNLEANQFIFNEPAEVDISFVIFHPRSRRTESIKLTSAVTINRKLDNFRFNQLELHYTASGESIPGKLLTAFLTAPAIAVDLSRQVAKATGLQIKSGEVTISADEINGSHIKDQPSFQGPVAIAPFSPVKVMKQLAIAPPAMRNANSLSSLAISFNLLATADSIDLQNLVMTLDDTRIKGSTSIKDFSPPAIAFNLNADALDADRYLPPEKAVDKSSKPLASPAAAIAASASLFLVETLRKLNANGELSLGKLKINSLTMQDIHLKLNAKNGIITTQQTVDQFYQGAYSGSVNMDARSNVPTLSLNEKITQVQIEPLLKDVHGKARMSGIANASAQLQGRGNTSDELKSSLNGQLNFLFKDGVIKGFNLQKIIDNSKALIKGTPLPTDNKNDQTVFSQMAGTATVSNGVIQNNDLVAFSSKARVNGQGNVNLKSEQLDYKIIAKLIKTKATATEPEQFHDTPIAIKISGSFSKPVYMLDAGSLLTDKNKAKVNKLLDKLDKKLGPGASDILKSFF
ncbi:AsmA family protein [Candidatus Methylobacter favarea]|nr:AsmA family protein [Candidatus Methylobacter favarea]